MAKYQKNEFVLVPNKSAIRGLAPNIQVLFLWLCDHSDDNMQSFPSRKALADECGISVRSVDRGMGQLVELGLIRKTPRSNGAEQTTNLYEVVVITQKEEVDKVATDSLPLATNTTLGSDTQSLGGDKNDTRNSIHLTQPIKLKIDTSVSIGNKPVVYGKPEINELFNYWELTTGLGIQAKRQANRNACSNMIKRHGADKVRQLIDGVALTQSDQYAPRISDFVSLQAKLNDLLVWGRRRTQDSTNGNIVVIS